jgi:hypothetical protein
LVIIHLGLIFNYRGQESWKSRQDWEICWFRTSDGGLNLWLYQDWQFAYIRLLAWHLPEGALGWLSRGEGLLDCLEVESSCGSVRKWARSEEGFVGTQLIQDRCSRDTIEGHFSQSTTLMN